MKTKIVIISCLCFSAATFMAIDLSGLTMHIEGLNTAFALDAQTGYQPGPGQNTSVPEPSTLLLIGIGVAGVGIYSFTKRKNRNKKN